MKFQLLVLAGGALAQVYSNKTTTIVKGNVTVAANVTISVVSGKTVTVVPTTTSAKVTTITAATTTKAAVSQIAVGEGNMVRAGSVMGSLALAAVAAFAL